MTHNFKYELTTTDTLNSKKEKQAGLRGEKRLIKKIFRKKQIRSLPELYMYFRNEKIELEYFSNSEFQAEWIFRDSKFSLKKYIKFKQNNTRVLNLFVVNFLQV